MKAVLKVLVVALLVAFALTACSLYDQINVKCLVTGYTEGLSIVTANYSAENKGTFDLTGVNLEIGVYLNISPHYVSFSEYTAPDFSLDTGEIKTGSVMIDISPYTLADISSVAVISVDMDNPKD